MIRSENQKKPICLVTGGSRGFGAGIARQLVKSGAKVWITGRSPDSVTGTAEQMGASPLVADACQAADWNRVVSQIMETDGRLDVLVNNVGAGVKIAPLVEQSISQIQESITVNLTSAILGARSVSRIMMNQKSGTIINVSSVCARVAWPGWSVYSAGKAGLVQFGKCLYTELRPHGVRVTTLIPSWGATDFASSASGIESHQAQIARQCIQPEELGDVVVSICQLPPHLAMQDLTIWPLVQELPSL